ncbi:hypothetical protein [Roseibium sp.]|uniref:hypothetical protein n=1 Tax=Roseibium sp. TaxID=1936156 RepID=UPI003BA96804
MNKLSKFATAALAASAIGIGGAHASEACNGFTVTAPLDDSRVVAVLSDDGSDLTAGDRRIGFSPLLDKIGNAVGTVDWQTQVLAGSVDSKARLSSDVVLNFREGSLFARSGVFTSDGKVVNAGTRTVSDDQVRHIVGGTGAFAGARGDITFTMQENGDAVFNVQVTCI